MKRITVEEIYNWISNQRFYDQEESKIEIEDEANIEGLPLEDDEDDEEDSGDKMNKGQGLPQTRQNNSFATWTYSEYKQIFNGIASESSNYMEIEDN